MNLGVAKGAVWFEDFKIMIFFFQNQIEPAFKCVSSVGRLILFKRLNMDLILNFFKVNLRVPQILLCVIVCVCPSIKSPENPPHLVKFYVLNIY